LLRERNVVAGDSYLCMNYTFYLLSNWVFLYLVQERNSHCQRAAGWQLRRLWRRVGSGIGGAMTALCCRRFGDRWGIEWCRSSVALAALLLLFVVTPQCYPRWRALALCSLRRADGGRVLEFGHDVGRGDAHVGLRHLEHRRHLGGLIGIPIVAHFSELHLWYIAFLIRIGFALVMRAWLASMW